METTAGSWALLGSVVPRDAHVVKRLRDAGAVLLGKAALSEWADMRSSNYSEGYSARGGQVRSAYNFTVNPGGSSSGSAVAVGSNAIAFSIGTETDGSGKNHFSSDQIQKIRNLMSASDQPCNAQCDCWFQAERRSDVTSRVSPFFDRRDGSIANSQFFSSKCSA